MNASYSGRGKLDGTPSMTSTPLTEVSRGGKRRKDKAPSSRERQEQQVSVSPATSPLLSPAISSPVTGGEAGPPASSYRSPGTQSLTADSAPQPLSVEATDGTIVGPDNGAKEQSPPPTSERLSTEIPDHPASTGGVSGEPEPEEPPDATPTDPVCSTVLGKEGAESAPDHVETPSSEPSGMRGHEIATMEGPVVDTGAESAPTETTEQETHPTEGDDATKCSNPDAPGILLDDGSESEPPDIPPPTHPPSESSLASPSEFQRVPPVVVTEGTPSLSKSDKSASEGVEEVSTHKAGGKVVDEERREGETSEVTSVQQSKGVEELQKVRYAMITYHTSTR